MENGFTFKFLRPDPGIAAFVENIGMFYNDTAEAKEVVVLPDGRIDLFFWKPCNDRFQVTLMGLETMPEQRYVPPQTKAFVVSFKPLAVEYILQTGIADILNAVRKLSDDYWGFGPDILIDFDRFYRKVSDQIKAMMPPAVDSRKLRLFDLVYASSGDIGVAELAAQVGWGSRQMNRYFRQRFGLSLKAYNNILRFRCSLHHIAHGKLFPQLTFTDQAYFIKAVKKFSGVVPKVLSRNENDRFLLLSVLKQQ